MKMKLANIKLSTFIDFDKKNNKEDPKLKASDHISISKYKNIFAKDYALNWPKEVSVIPKLEVLCRRHMLLFILTVKKLLEYFRKTYCKKQIKKNLE